MIFYKIIDDDLKCIMNSRNTKKEIEIVKVMMMFGVRQLQREKWVKQPKNILCTRDRQPKNEWCTRARQLMYEL